MNNKKVKEKGERVEPFKNHSISCARGGAWTARAEDHKGLNNREGKEEPWKRGKKDMNNKEEDEEPWKFLLE